MPEPTRWRKKPVEIEAMQWTGDNADDLTQWTDGAFIATDRRHPATLYVAANQTRLPIALGEWVLHDDAGFYPCRADIFAATYEPVIHSGPTGPAFTTEPAGRLTFETAPEELLGGDDA